MEDLRNSKKVYAVIVGDCRFIEGTEVYVLKYIKSTNTYWCKSVETGYEWDVAPQNLKFSRMLY